MYGHQACLIDQGAYSDYSAKHGFPEVQAGGSCLLGACTTQVGPDRRTECEYGQSAARATTCVPDRNRASMTWNIGSAPHSTSCCAKGLHERLLMFYHGAMRIQLQDFTDPTQLEVLKLEVAVVKPCRLEPHLMSARRFQPDVLQVYHRACYRADVVRRVAGAILVALVAHVGTVRADCFDDAAAYHHVNPWILRAIAARESGFKPNTLVSNSNHTVDIGQAGINSVHLPELARYGISREDLLDGCKSTYVSGWQLAKKIHKFGNPPVPI